MMFNIMNSNPFIKTLKGPMCLTSASISVSKDASQRRLDLCLPASFSMCLQPLPPFGAAWEISRGNLVISCDSTEPFTFGVFTF